MNAQPEPDESLLVEVVSDFVCPWCWIGKREFDRYTEGRAIDRRWRPYFLHPGLPKEGIGRKELMLMKFGPDGAPAGAGAAIRELASSLDLPMDFDRIDRVPNTLDAHRLSRWAQGAGVGDAVAEGLFRAYFAEGRDIGNCDVLAAIASAEGMDGNLVRELLSGDDDREAVTEMAEEARDLGISGVPTHVFGRRVMVVGAQDEDALLRAETRARTA
ncbi:MAG: DsbA family oxidoreductase [Pacificimonas sp.]